MSNLITYKTPIGEKTTDKQTFEFFLQDAFSYGQIVLKESIQDRKTGILEKVFEKFIHAYESRLLLKQQEQDLEENTTCIIDILSEIYDASLVIYDMAIAAQEMSNNLEHVKNGFKVALSTNTVGESLKAELKSVKKEIKTISRMDRCCSFCGEKNEILKCSRCNKAFYCNKECQKNDWGKHKNLCRTIVKE